MAIGTGWGRRDRRGMLLPSRNLHLPERWPSSNPDQAIQSDVAHYGPDEPVVVQRLARPLEQNPRWLVRASRHRQSQFFRHFFHLGPLAVTPSLPAAESSRTRSPITQDTATEGPPRNHDTFPPCGSLRRRSRVEHPDVDASQAKYLPPPMCPHLSWALVWRKASFP